MRRNAEAEAFARPGAWLAGAPRVWVFGIERADRAEHDIGIGAIKGEDRDAIERAASRDYAYGGERAARGFQTYDSVESGGHAAGAGSVSAQSEGDQMRRNGYGGAGTRAARDIAVIEDAGAGAVR